MLEGDLRSSFILQRYTQGHTVMHAQRAGIAVFLEKFRQSKAVDAVFYGLRAASVALITAALLQVAKIALLTPGQPWEGMPFQLNLAAVILAVIIFVLVKFSPLKKLHPVCFIGLAALAGIVFQM